MNLHDWYRGAGVYEDVPEAEYHADTAVPGGSLSYSGMKQLLKSPAHYRHYMDAPRVEKKAFDAGHIIHAMVLGTGLDVTVIPDGLLAANGAASTKEAKQFVAEARLDGLIPVKQAELDPLQDIAEAVLAHDVARALFENDGPTELSMFAVDEPSGVWVRGRADKVSELDGDLVLVDLKTTPDADPREFNRQLARFQYFLQAHVYSWLAQTTGVTETIPEMVFVAVSKTEPHTVSVTRLDWLYMDLGKQQMRLAVDRYKACMESGVWPAYPTISELSPPAWMIADDDEEIEIN